MNTHEQIEIGSSPLSNAAGGPTIRGTTGSISSYSSNESNNAYISLS